MQSKPKPSSTVSTTAVVEIDGSFAKVIGLAPQGRKIQGGNHNYDGVYCLGQRRTLDDSRSRLPYLPLPIENIVVA